MFRTILSPLLILLFSLIAFGQSYEGFYKARFISLDRNVNPIAEFQIQPNGAVSGKIIIGESAAIIKGQADFNGNLEAKSEGSRELYTLKADMKRSDGKITLSSRSEEKSFGRQAGSQAMMQGSYTRIEKSASENSQALTKSQLLVEQPNPLFEKEFSEAKVQVTVEKTAFLNLYHFQMMGGGENSERGFYFSIARGQDSPQKVWNIDNIRAINYIEKTENYTKVNRFRINYEMWLKNRSIGSGQIELISENSRQMVFKVTNLKIKNESNNDFVTINGTLYAEISK